ncbi:5-methylcytosine restriction system specificity protein McrC [Priestia sp. TGN 0903]|uniref:5-methylcytosine restriction system specificity protein McrC n=1 Tax=Priestia sp. TGN 0903 TaxID=3420730 RepID=UPI003D77975E
MTKNKQLLFHFKDYTFYKKLEAVIEGKLVPIEQGSPEFQAFEIAVNEKIKPSKLTANLTETGYNDGDKLKFIDFDPIASTSMFETKGLVGVVQVKDIPVKVEEDESILFDVKIMVTSRFDEEKPYFLSYMLSYENPNFSDDYQTESNKESLFTILLLYLFKKQLQEAFKQGMFKTYQRQELNNDRLKGTIDIGRHIKENMIFNGKVAYSTKEHTVDNTINNLILHTYHHLKQSFPNESFWHMDSDNKIRTIIKKLKEAVPSFYTSNISKVMVRSLTPLSHPFYSKYEALRKTCIKIMRNLGVSVFDGTEELVSGLLFYIPDLWEKFLLHSYKKYSSDEQFVVHISNKIRIFKESGDNSFRKEIRPDFVFRRNDRSPFFILDAKFKPKWYEVAENRGSLSSVYDDYLQVINYMISFNTVAAGVIFPTNQGLLSKHAFDLSPYNTRNRFYCFALYVPKVEDTFSKWKRNFELNVRYTFSEIFEMLGKL